MGQGSESNGESRLEALEAENARLRQALGVAGVGQPADGATSFHAIADSIDQMIWSTRADGFHDYFNQRWYDYTGVPDGSTDGEGWNGMFHPDDQERAWGVWRHSLQTGEPYHIEYRLRHRSGQYRWVLGRAQPVRDEAGRILRWYGTCTDIHDLKTAQDKLRESEARAQGVLNGMGEGFALFSPDFILIDLNAEGVRLDGRAREDLLGRHLLDIWPEAERLPAWPAFQKALSERRRQTLEYHHLSDRHDVWLEVRTYPVDAGLAVFYRSIGARKRAQAEAEATRMEAEALAAEQAAILAQLAEGVIVTDAEGRITFVNEAAERLHGVKLLGVPPDEYAERYRLLTVAGEPYPTHELPLARAVRTGETVVDARWRIRRPDGSEVLAIGSARPIRLPSGESSGAVLTVRDDTERHAAEQALRDSEERMRLVVDSARDYAILTVDPDRRITSWSNGAAAIFGYSVEQAIGQSADIIFTPEDRAAGVPEREMEAARETGCGNDERWHLRADGGRVFMNGSVHPLPLREDGSERGFLKVARDETERRAVGEALRESEARLRALTDNLPMAMVYQVVTSRDLSERRFVYVSANCEPLVGVTAADATADPAVLYGLVVPDQREALVAAEQAAAAVLGTFDFQMNLCKPDGVLLRCRVISRPRELAGGDLIWDGILIDITEREAAREAAERTAALLRAVGDATLDNIYAKDRDCRFLYANAATGATLGRSPAALIGLSNHDVAFSADEADTITANDLRIMAAGRTEVVEEVLTSPDGQSRFYRSAKAPMRDASGAVIGLAGVSADISDQKSAQAALTEESRTLETLNRTGAALAAELDLERLVQMVTDAGVELTGAQFGAFFYNVLNEAGESLMLFTLTGAERSQFDFGMPRATAIFKPTFDGDGVIRSDDILADHRYGKEEPHRGMPKGHLPVRSYLAVPVTSRSGEVIGGLFFGHAERGQFTERHERLIVGVAAQAAIGIDNARLYQAAHKELAERMRAEERLRLLNETLEQRVAEEVTRRAEVEDALRQAQKMETLGQLTGGVAHDFNNLLQIVSGNLEILQRNLPPDGARLRRAAENAARGAERAAVLTQRLLAFSRRQPLAPKPISINKLVSGMSELLHRTLGEMVEVETVLASGLWAVEADPNQLENAILNLAVNARDAMPGGGKLTIETANTHLDRAYAATHAGVAPGQYVAICVSDSGAGMEPETLERVFEPFFTTKDVGRGTGLGLSMVYGFVKQSGGHVKIYSEPGEGTTVKIYLPRLHGAVEEEREEPAALIPEGTQGETILVCEDDDDVRAYSVEVLRELGYRVLEAHDGPSALRLLERQEGEVDLLFTDVVLPSGMMGNKLAEEARAVRPGLKVLFTSGYARSAIVHHGRLDPGVELITKPFSYAELAARIRDLLDGPAGR